MSLLVAGLFLATLGSDAFGAHACPHHDAFPGESGVPADAGHAAHAGHGLADEPAEHDSHGPCTCIGQCASTGGVVPAEAPVLSAVPEPVSRADRLHAARRESLPQRPDFLIPFANAPPLPFQA